MTSTKDISNSSLEFADGTTQKLNDLSGLDGTFSGTGDNAEQADRRRLGQVRLQRLG